MLIIIYQHKRNGITVICGGYGSGKSEIAVNFALKQREIHHPVAIIDMDIVNPYFRSREAQNAFAANDIELVAPAGELATSALPALPGKIYSVLRSENIETIIDLGGDDIGAKAMARFSHQLNDYEMFMVVNVLRPFQENEEQIADLARSIEQQSKLKITGLINNTNLLRETDEIMIMDSYPVIEAAAKRLNVPIVYTSLTRNYVEKYGFPPKATPFFIIDLHLSPSWRK